MRITKERLKSFGFTKNGIFESMKKLIQGGDIFDTYLIVASDGESWIELRKGQLDYQSHSFHIGSIKELKTLWKSLSNKELKSLKTINK